MDSADMLLRFLGWCTAINFGLLTVAALAVVTFRQPLMRLHGKMFGLEEGELSRLYFQYLAFYKVGVIIFNFVPWVALLMIA